MKILIDMNLSPEWVRTLTTAGIESVHWSTIGSPNAPDREIMNWALDNSYIVFTNDLDFGTLLAVTQANSQAVLFRFVHKTYCQMQLENYLSKLYRNLNLN